MGPDKFPAATRRLLEDMLRPFVVANKGKFLDLPDRAFKTPSDEDRSSKSRQGLHRNISMNFNTTN